MEHVKPIQSKSLIRRSTNSKEEEKKYLEALNKHFKAVTCEKHPDAMLNIIFTDAYEKILGRNFRKQRISKKKEKKLKNEIISRLRHKYGRWINLTNFKIKNPAEIYFQTNFNRVYKVEDMGILYGSPSELICDGIFYTSHCLERFEERANPEFYDPITEEMKKIYKTEPTSADIMIGLIMSSNMEYGRWKDFCYLNVRVGALVLENLTDVFIAKTFLTPDMLHPEMTWYQPLIAPDEHFSSFKELMEIDFIKIEKPSFIFDELYDIIGDLFLDRE